MRFLFVENHPAFREVVVSEFLSEYEIHSANTIDAARARIAALAFHCLLVDFDLDDGKGADLVRSCRGEGFKGVIIGVSAHEFGNAALLAAGADDTCSKMRFNEIGDIIQRAANRRGL